MTVRLTPTEPDSTLIHQDPAKPRASDRGLTDQAGTAEPLAMSGESDHEAPPEVNPGSSDTSTVPGEESGSTEPADPDGPGDCGSTDSRIALREARRSRRRTAWLCVAVVAVCLALTIVVVSLARTRPPPSSGTLTASAAPTNSPSDTLVSADPHQGASAPEGGNR